MKKTWYKMKALAQNSAEILIYDEIGYWGTNAKEFKSDLDALGDISDLTIRINSPGGSIIEGFAIYNMLKQHKAKIKVYVDGMAASMASVIAMAGDTVVMPQNAMMMIHKPWLATAGDAEELRKNADLLDKLESQIINIYSAKTGMADDELAEMLKNETWLTGTEAVERKFADELIEPMQAAALFNNKKEEIKMADKDIQDTKTEPQTPIDQTPKPDDAVAKQSARTAGIKDVFKQFEDQDKLLIDCLADVNCSVEDARSKLLTALGNAKPSVATGYVGNGNITGDSIKSALLAKAGHATKESNNPYNSMTLREMARNSLTERGVGTASLNPLEMVGLAFTHSTSDFGSILIDVAHKSVLKGWEGAPENYEEFTTKGILTDFRPAYRVGLGNFKELPQVLEGEEYTYGTIGDQKLFVALATYGQLFSITRQAIINDDLNILTTIPTKFGKAARATIAKLVYANITGNPTMDYDGKALFDSTHKNTLKGIIDVANIDKAITLMNAQTAFDGTLLNIEPTHMLVPTSQFTRAKQVIGSASVEGVNINEGIINPIRDIVPIVKSHRLQADNADTYYLMNKEAIEVSYLNGVEAPFIDQMQGFTSDGVTTKVRIDAGAKILDHRGIVRVKK